MLKLFLQIWRRLIFYVRRGRFDRELEEEMKFHLEMKAGENLAAGMSPEEARYASQQQFGNQTLLQEASREMWGFRSIETLIQDLRFGIRMFLKNPGLTAVLILTIALGIGLNSALFSVVNTLLLNPLPFHDADRLVYAWTRSDRISSDRLGATLEEFEEWRKQQQSFTAITALARTSFNLSGTDEPERISSAWVSPNFFSLLGIKPVLGRDFLPEDEDLKGGRVVILSHSLWQRRFNADPSLIGRTITLNDLPYVVVGILPPGFRFPQIQEGISGTELWTPLELRFWRRVAGGAPFLSVFARLKPGVALEAAQDELNSIARRLETAYSQTHSGKSVHLVSLQEQVVGGVRYSLLVLFGAVLIVLLIACANISNLLMARAAGRRREMALRLAIGASRLRLIRQLLTEGILLAVIGGGLGLLVAFFAKTLLLSLSEQSIPRADEVAIDTRVLLFTLSLSVIIGLAFSILPAILASSMNPNQFLKEGGKPGTAGRSGNRFRGMLIVIQVALALVLSISAGLLTRSFLALLNVDPGFDPKRVLTFDLFLSSKKDPAQGAGFYRQLTERLDALPGVEAAGAVNALPLDGSFTWTFFIEGRQPVDVPLGRVEYQIVTPDFFRTVGIPLMKGRVFTDQDGRETMPVGIINEAMARLYWPNEDPIGKRLRVQGPINLFPWATVIGVVGDVKHNGLDRGPSPAFYRPHQQHPRGDMTLVVRTQADPMTLANSVRNQVREMDRDLPISNLREYTYFVAKSVAQRRFAMSLLAIFAAIALALALFGIYGVLSYSVSQRTQELAIRQALGAQPRDVLALVVRQGMYLVSVGIIVGLAAAFGATRVMTSMLYEIKPLDLTTFVTVPSLIAGIAALACYLPARRASKANPMVALRNE